VVQLPVATKAFVPGSKDMFAADWQRMLETYVADKARRAELAAWARKSKAN